MKAPLWPSSATGAHSRARSYSTAVRLPLIPQPCFTINPVDGDTSVIPQKRRYVLSFKDVAAAEKVFATLDGKRVAFEQADNDGTIRIIAEIAPGEKFRVTMRNITVKKNPPRKEMLTDLLSKVQGSNNAKMVLFGKCLKDSFDGKVFADKAVRDSIKEILEISE